MKKSSRKRARRFFYFLSQNPLLNSYNIERPFKLLLKEKLGGVVMTRMECVEAMEIHSDMVYRIALNYCRNKYDAEDITQEVFCKLVRVSNIPSGEKGSVTFNDDEHLKRWLIRVTVNECHSLFVTPWHKKTKYLEDEAVEEGVCNIEEKSELYQAVMSLPKKYRIVIYLYYYEEYSTKEIGEILDIKEATVRAQLMRGRDTLRKKIKEGDLYEYRTETI